MNYQLMFQTIAIMCGITTMAIAIVTEMRRLNSYKWFITAVILFTITVITAALAAGLS